MYQSKAQVNSVMVKIKIMLYASQKDIKHRLGIDQSAATAHDCWANHVAISYFFGTRTPLFFLSINFSF